MDYFNSNENGNSMRQKDLVLAPNEFVFLQNKTNGVIKTHTGPIMTTISQQESLVVFDKGSKQFKEVSNFDQAKQLFVSAPENWYIILKNPTEKNEFPELGKPSMSPALQIGRKVNITGPASFSLFPGQMAKVVRGHALRSNQYLLARVYEAESAAKSAGEILDIEGNKVESTETYVNGQILVIKGTEVSFYIPPTGIEVIPVNNDPDKGYVREAVTLERLEYCILKDEDGNKRYIHGPKVVFPKPTETFVASSKDNLIFRAIELSPISGIYVKVIAEYKDNEGEANEVTHPVGEELFITGNDQMIYYPRPEHAIINYDNKIMHHAIAIPEGEGRYIMDRLTGEITTVKGPKMYLPDPRTEVVVRRKLTENQCKLWYPGNREVLEYNVGLTEKAVEKNVAKTLDMMTAYCSTYNSNSTLANLEAKANISRGTSYTKPRTITLDNKLEGVVTANIWTGYAVNIISKNGDRKVVCGPQTVMLDYDQTFEELELSTGTPKNDRNPLRTVYLRHENNKVSDRISVETKDFVRADVTVSYCVDFHPDDMDKWFSIENYVKYLCDRERALIKRVAKDYTIEEFYQNYSNIVRSCAIAKPLTIDDTAVESADSKNRLGMYFPENGMYVYDCEVLGISVQSDIEELLLDHQQEMVAKTLELADAAKSVELAEALSEAEQRKRELHNQEAMQKMALQEKEAMEKMAIQARIARQQEAEAKAAKEAEKDLQVIKDAILEAELARKAKAHEQEVQKQKDLAAIEKAKQEAYAATVEKIMSAISPDLIASLEVNGKCNFAATLAEHMSPYAISNGESVVDTTTRLLNGLGFDDIVEIMKKSQ